MDTRCLLCDNLCEDDLSIGEVKPLCAECYDELVGEVVPTETVAALKTELAALKAKLPKCWRLDEDGKLVQDVDVTPGMELWSILDNPQRDIGLCPAMMIDGEEWESQEEMMSRFDAYYNSKAAAEAARGAGG